MADVNRILQVEMVSDSLQIVGVMIHVMAVARLGGAAMAAPVVGDDAITLLEEKQHRRVPVISRQWPAVAEHDGLAFAPVLIVDVDVGFVFFSDSYVWHRTFSSFLVGFN